MVRFMVGFLTCAIVALVEDVFLSETQWHQNVVAWLKGL